MSDTIDRPLDNDPLAEEFFSQPPPPTETASEAWEPRPMSVAQHRAMRATLTMLLFVAAVTACFVAYAEIAMVKPAPLGNAGLPRIALAQPLPQLPPQPRPEETAAPAPAPAREQLLVATDGDAKASTEARPSTEAQPSAEARPSTVQVSAVQPSAEAQPSAAMVVRKQAVAAVPDPRPLALHPQTSRAAAHDAPLKGAATPRGRLDNENSARVDSLTKQAYRELRQGQAQQASDLASHAIRLDPTRASAYIALGGARDALGDHAGARTAFRDCARRAGDSLVSACRTLAR